MMKLEVLYPSSSLSTELLSVGASVPIGQSGLVHIVGCNDANVPRHMGIHWVVREPPTIEDPDGVVVEDYEDWASVLGIKIELDPEDDHEFIGGRFDLDKLGTYSIAVSLLMNPDSPVIVDSYEGALCTTTTEVPPECRTDADCPEGYVCVNGVCVPEEEVEKKFPWTPVLIGTGAVIAIAGLAAAKKGVK